MPKAGTVQKFGTISICGLLAFASAQAQTKTLLRAKIPFEFSIDKKVLAAGNYEFRLDSSGRSITVTGGKNALYATVITRLGDTPSFREASLVFDSYENHRTLAEVWIPGEDGLLVHSRIGTPSVMHNLQSEPVDSVIAYVRTLKKQ